MTDLSTNRYGDTDQRNDNHQVAENGTKRYFAGIVHIRPSVQRQFGCNGGPSPPFEYSLSRSTTSPSSSSQRGHAPSVAIHVRRSLPDSSPASTAWPHASRCPWFVAVIVSFPPLTSARAVSPTAARISSNAPSWSSPDPRRTTASAMRWRVVTEISLINSPTCFLAHRTACGLDASKRILVKESFAAARNPSAVRSFSRSSSRPVSPPASIIFVTIFGNNASNSAATTLGAAATASTTAFISFARSAALSLSFCTARRPAAKAYSVIERTFL